MLLSMLDKPIQWLSSSLEDLSSDFKSISVVGAGVQEIRIRTEDAYRIFYIARFEEAVYVLHAFQKKTQKTSKLDIEIGQKRYQQMLQHRKDKQDEQN
jgi:phage-related protein